MRSNPIKIRSTTKLTFSSTIIAKGPERNTATCYTGASQEVSTTAPELSGKKKQSNITDKFPTFNFKNVKLRVTIKSVKMSSFLL